MKITNLIAIGHILSYNVFHPNGNIEHVEYSLYSLLCSNYVVCFKQVFGKNKLRQYQFILSTSELSEFDDNYKTSNDLDFDFD